MEVLKLLNFKQPILLLKILSNGNLGIIDAQNTLRILDGASYDVLDGFKTNIHHEQHLGSYVDMTTDGEYTVSAIAGTHKAGIFSLSKRELLYKAGHHQGDVESVGVDPNGRYFVTCGQDGKGFAWVLKTSRLAFALPPHADYVSTVAFSDNGQWIATGGYDKIIILFNIATMKEPVKLYGHSSVIVKMIFLPEAKLLSVDRDGNVIVWNIGKGKVLKRLTKMNDDVTSMCISTTKRFVFIGTKLGYVGLYDMQTMELISQHYVKVHETVTSLALLSNPFRLAISTLKGDLLIYSLFGDEKRYKDMLRDGGYKAFYDALDDNPMLLYSKLYEVAEKIWLDTVEKGRHLLEKNERQKAKEIFAPFAVIGKKQSFISQMLSSYEKYEQYRLSAQEGHLALAYSLAKQYPSFQDSEIYRKMELKWKKNFFKAQELILTPNGEDQARELLAQYRGISEKTVLIQQLFEQRKMYVYFKKTIAQRDYVKFFSLVKMYPFLKEFEEYTAVMEYADKLYIQTQKAYAEGDFATARKGCEILISFPDYAQEAYEVGNTIRIKHLFYEAISSNNLSNAFSYLSLYPLLYETREGQILEREWNSAVDRAQKYAAAGNASETRAVFEPYFGIRDKFMAMAGVVSQAYCVQLEEKIRRDFPLDVIERGIRNYVTIFGIDEGMISILEYLKRVTQSKIDLTPLKKGSLETWAPMMRIDDITARV
ncbi:MAG TPA: hypothetical protein VJA83_04860 [Sulfuricurvum sp.]|nr:hypothetical protein [Sulfuricurvum sp.]